ncbi:sugar transport related membrane protein [Thermoplasma acidophilum]|uniref:Sugar transport related membrane protein n=1 Tax=Thermoplasma acidophilum (strain ATCC 25905 / DSM 1728 / JCM 9062 / NBRC 15155 / AMRC-C165) TaxID=273075 RepID=Q9HJ10_THEAC|nr:MFS transporter [Thermoplasma acidophilum]MCY0851897.1 MFS transporter [Thermoplasma acidophilum]CAC12290.1 sugar transport related membrane protein [Thermoplasma acidophilum]
MMNENKINGGKPDFTRRYSARNLLISASAGMFIWGIIASVAPLATQWPFISALPRSYEAIFLAAPSVFLLIGDLSLGRLSDLFGRKAVYVSTIVLYLLGIFIIYFAYSVIPLIIGIALAEIGVGGEEVTALSLIAEDLPVRKRGRYLVLIPNMNNIGSFVIAFLFLYFYSSSIHTQKLYFLLLGIATVFLAVYTRARVPESFRWLKEKGRDRAADEIRREMGINDDGISVREPNYALTLIFLGIIGISQYLTFGLMAYIIGPYFFSNQPNFTSEIIVYAMAGASVAGFIAMFLINMGRKRYSMLSYLGGTVTMILILALIRYISDPAVFLPLLFLNMMFSEFAWASRTTLEPELFGTGHRSYSIGLVRIFPILAYIASIYTTSSFTLNQYIIFNLILWGVGFIATVFWAIYGIETKNISMDFTR